MKVIFLDIDGVMNSKEFDDRYDEYLSTIPDFSERPNFPIGYIDPLAVGFLKEVCEETNSFIVISSAWRVPYNPVKIAGFLKEVYEHEFEGTWDPPVIGEIDKDTRDTPLFKKTLYRQDMIKSWIVRNKRTVENYLILEDCEDMSKHNDENVIMTDPRYGFTEGDKFVAIEKLRKNVFDLYSD